MGTWQIELRLSDGVTAEVNFDGGRCPEGKALDEAADRFARAAAGVFIERAQGTLGTLVESIRYIGVDGTKNYRPEEVKNTPMIPRTPTFECIACGERSPKKDGKHVCQSCGFDEGAACPDCGGTVNRTEGVCEVCRRKMRGLPDE